MQDIPISQIVQVNPNVISAGGGQSSLDGLFLTPSTALPPGQMRTFFSAAEVGQFFGPSSAEQTAATVYFAGILGGGKLPASLNFARFAQADTPAGVYGAPVGQSLTALQALSGTLVVTTSALFESAEIDLAGATSFADAAARMTAGFTAPDFSITYDAQRRRFLLLTTTATGEAATSSAVTGTLAAGVGLATSAGAYVQSVGVLADTGATAMDRVVAQSSNWGIFSHVWAADMDTRLELAEWNSAQPTQFIFAGWDTDPESIVPENPNSFGSTVMTLPYQGTVPVYGGVEIVAGVMAWSASTNFLAIEGRTALAFRQIAAGPAPSASSLAVANALLSNGYTYLGAYASESNNYTVLYDGKISGQFEWADTYLGGVWLRRTLQQALFETLLAYNTLPYNSDGYNAIYQGAQDTIAQALANGVIRAGVALSPSQRAQANTQAGLRIDDQLSSLGWYLQVTDPLSASVRTERGSPIVNFWYCDGGSIQKLVVSSTTVL